MLTLHFLLLLVFQHAQHSDANDLQQETLPFLITELVVQRVCHDVLVLEQFAQSVKELKGPVRKQWPVGPSLLKDTA